MKTSPTTAAKNALATSRMGRVLLHAWCVFKHPAHLRWHWDGIVREIRHA